MVTMGRGDYLGAGIEDLVVGNDMAVAGEPEGPVSPGPAPDQGQPSPSARP